MNKNTPAAKGVRTAYQSIIGFMVGLVAVVWAVPGVPEAITDYILNNWLTIVSSLGLSTGVFSGLFALLQNKAEDK